MVLTSHGMLPAGSLAPVPEAPPLTPAAPLAPTASPALPMPAAPAVPTPALPAIEPVKGSIAAGPSAASVHPDPITKRHSARSAGVCSEGRFVVDRFLIVGAPAQN